jgi:hypothetical protein
MVPAGARFPLTAAGGEAIAAALPKRRVESMATNQFKMNRDV